MQQKVDMFQEEENQAIYIIIYYTTLLNEIYLFLRMILLWNTTAREKIIKKTLKCMLLKYILGRMTCEVIHTPKILQGKEQTQSYTFRALSDHMRARCIWLYPLPVIASAVEQLLIEHQHQKSLDNTPQKSQGDKETTVQNPLPLLLKQLQVQGNRQCREHLTMITCFLDHIANIKKPISSLWFAVLIDKFIISCLNPGKHSKIRQCKFELKA